jgi:hypothetical protein
MLYLISGTNSGVSSPGMGVSLGIFIAFLLVCLALGYFSIRVLKFIKQADKNKTEHV